MNYTYFILLTFFFTSILSFGQADTENADSNMDSKYEFSYDDLDTLTKVRLTEFYSAQEIEELKSDINKLKFLNYSIAGSFRVKEGQEYEIEDYLKIDISEYTELIEEDSIIEVYDEGSGLYILIDSKNMAANKLELLGVVQHWAKPPSENKTTD